MENSLDIIIRLRQEGANDQAILDYLKNTGQSAEQATAALQKFNTAAAATNTGSGLAVSPAGAMNQKGPEGLTDGQIEGMAALESAYERVIGKKKALGEATTAEEMHLAKVREALKPVREAYDQLQYNLQNILAARAAVNVAAQAEANSLEKVAASAAKNANARRAETEEANRQKKVVEELKKSQEDATREDEKAASKKRELTDAAKGLGFEIPRLGQALRLVTGGVVALFSAAAAYGAVKTLEWADRIDELSDKLRSFGNLKDQIDPFAAIQARGDADQAAFTERLDAIGKKYREVRAEVDETTRSLLLQEKLFGELQDAKLKRDEETIKAAVKQGTMTEGEGIEATAQAQSDAKARKKEREFQLLERQVEMEAQAARDAAARAAQAKAELEGLQPAINTQDAVTQASRKDASNIPAAYAQEIERLTKLREIAEQFVTHPNRSAADFSLIGAQADISLTLGRRNAMTDPARAASELDERIATMKKAIADSVTAQAQEEAKLAELTRKRTRLQQEVERNEQAAVDAIAKKSSIERELNIKRFYEGETRPVIEEADAIRVQREQDEALKKAGDKGERAFKRSINDAAKLFGGGASQDFVDRNAPLPDEFKNIDIVREILREWGHAANGSIAELMAEVQDLRDELALMQSQRSKRRSY